MSSTRQSFATQTVYSNPSSPSRKSIITEKTLDMHLNNHKKSQSLKWGSVNILLLSIIIFDIRNKSPLDFSNWLYLEYAASFILGSSIFYYFARYFYYLFSFEPLHGTDAQRKLLKFKDGDTSFVTTTAVKTPGGKDDLKTSPVNNISGLSWHSFNDSKNITVPSPGWLFRKGSPQNSFNQSYGQNNSMMNSSFNRSGMSPNSSSNFVSPYKMYSSKENFITDENKLQQYLKENSINEETNFDEATQQNPHQSSLNSFWNNFKLDDVAGMLKTSFYQLSPTTVSPNKKASIDEVTMFTTKDLQGNSEVLRKISSAKLSQYVANLRIWISSTVLQRLVFEINSTDSAFMSRGFSDIQIGTVGLERLKKTAENQQLVSVHIPMLPLIISFLEMSSNQEYLVQRIKSLSKSSCIGDYRWNSGSPYNGLNWDEHLPTDSSIIFHLFCSYLDSQLRPLPQPGGRPFFNRYVIVGDKKTPTETLAEVKNKANCAILCTNLMKPKFNFISDDKIHNCVNDRNNLFYVIIQFLIYMKNHHDGLLEGVNLGKSGINLLCVIEE